MCDGSCEEAADAVVWFFDLRDRYDLPKTEHLEQVGLPAALGDPLCSFPQPW